MKQADTDRRDAMSSPSNAPLSPVLLRSPYFRSQTETPTLSPSPSPLPPRLPFESKLNFQYKGDIFGQHGTYTDATLYMSRMPSSRKGSILRPKAGAAYRVQKLEPMPSHPRAIREPSDDFGVATTTTTQPIPFKPSKVGRKRQFALAVEAMAANPSLRGSLLADNIIPSVLSLLRTKDAATLASCLATLCHISSDSLGRDAILKNSALPLLTSLSTSFANVHDDRQSALHNYLATLANLTIEDSFESVFVKEKALGTIMKHRNASPLAEQLCTFTLHNLSCPAYSYPRVDEVIRAITDFGREAYNDIHRETISRALYNLSCARINQLKLVEGEAVSLLRTLLVRRPQELDTEARSSSSSTTAEAIRLNALMALWRLAENPLCRRAITRPDCIRALVDQLHSSKTATPVDAHLQCTLLTLISLASDRSARQQLIKADALSTLALVIQRLSFLVTAALEAVVGAMYRLVALILSTPASIPSVERTVLSFLLSYRIHDQPNVARYVLFSLVSIMWWSDGDASTSTYSPSTAAASRGKPSSSSSSSPSDSHGLDAVTSVSATTHLDELLDDPSHLDPLVTLIDESPFAIDSTEAYLQLLLLYNISFRFNYRVDVAQRAAPRLATLLSLAATPARLVRVACATVFCLCQEYETHHVLHAAGVFAVLPQLLRRADAGGDTHTMALEVVCVVFDAKLLDKRELVTLLALLVPTLVALCDQSDDTTLRAGCAACFARFAAVDESCRAALAEHGGIRALALLAADRDVETLRRCVFAYSFLSRDAALGASLIHGGIVKSLTLLAAAPEASVRRACAMTLCNLSRDERHVAVLTSAGALKALLVIACVKSNDPETRRVCLHTVLNLLRLPSTVAALCQDGLLWAFTLFAGAMEAREDLDMLCDGFAALAFYPQTRKGVVKPAILDALLGRVLGVVRDPAMLPTKVKLLKGLSNVLCDRRHAAHLVHAGALPYLLSVVDEEGEGDHTARSLVAQLLVLLFQGCPEVEDAFAAPETLQAIDSLLRHATSTTDTTESTDTTTDCGRCCAVLLFLMSLHGRTRLALGPLLPTLPSRFRHAARETHALLVRLYYNVSQDRELAPLLDATQIMQSLATLVKKPDAQLTQAAVLGAGLLRNLSCAPTPTHATALLSEDATTLMQRLFALDDAACQEDTAVCLCNLLLGPVNSHAVLARGVLPLLLRLCARDAAPESRLVATAVLRKLSLAPGNAALLVDGGAISHLALMLQDTTAPLQLKQHCVATFGALVRRPGVPQVLASYGVVAHVLELLRVQQRPGSCGTSSSMDPTFQGMCVDLLSALAAFANADDPTESQLASILFELVETGDSESTATTTTTTTTTTSAWQSDRSFLVRGDGDGATLPLPTPSIAHTRVATYTPKLRHSLHPIRYSGFAVNFAQLATPIELRTVEPTWPSLVLLGEPPDPHDDAQDVDAVVAGEGVAAAMPPPLRLELAPLPMFPKITTPFTATASTNAASSHQQL